MLCTELSNFELFYGTSGVACLRTRTHAPSHTRGPISAVGTTGFVQYVKEGGVTSLELEGVNRVDVVRGARDVVARCAAGKAHAAHEAVGHDDRAEVLELRGAGVGQPPHGDRAVLGRRREHVLRRVHVERVDPPRLGRQWRWNRPRWRRLARAPGAVAERLAAWSLPVGVPSRPQPPGVPWRERTRRSRALPKGEGGVLNMLWRMRGDLYHE